MSQTLLTDEEAHKLIQILKLVIKKYKVDLSPGNQGNISLKSIENHNFIMTYYTPKHRDDKLSIHVREKQTNTNLARINIDPTGFHKNSDGNMIRGNRLLLFSSEEFKGKNDGFTHVQAMDLPHDFTDVGDLEQVFLDFLMYINVKEEGKIKFPNLF